ncbi:hypothetical protein MKQ68_20265 [Chitinophaga horti]|uniref:Oligosaccharide repeat unit polymerase n=1 Tax=Chitinophaga horti TaxID=2920382 RepID=A0ABY6IYF5_9BACT|nr:hypothetical protein [Chitinophaga horti]UYQ92421.1 hypothetical protein MKQ68_20265 [Chitinophaga horti]
MLIFAFLYVLFLIFLSVRKFGVLMNPFFFEAHFPLLFLIVPQLIMVGVFPESEDNVKSDWVIIAYVTALFAGTMTNLKSFSLASINSPSRVAGVDLATAGVFIAPTLPILFACGLTLGGIRCYYETVVFSQFASLYDLGKTFLFLSIMLLLAHKRKFTPFTIGLMFLLVFSGNKFAIFNLLLFFAIFFEEYRGIKFQKMLIWAVPIFLLFIGYHFMQSRTYFENPFLAAIRYFDIYEKQSFLLDELSKPRAELYHGEIYVSSWYKYIPRLVWPGKPVAFGFAILNYDFLPDEAAANYMPSFGLGTIYADFGFYSVIIIGFFTGFLRKYTYQIFLKSGKNNASLILYYFGIAPLTVIYLAIQYLVSFCFKPKANHDVVH